VFAIKQHNKNKTMNTKEIKEFRNIWSNPKRFDTKNEKPITFFLTYKDFVRMVAEDMRSGAAPDEYASDNLIHSRAQSYYKEYLNGASLDELFLY
jgi:hypothetical protein